jgi:hypothetical protein
MQALPVARVAKFCFAPRKRIAWWDGAGCHRSPETARQALSEGWTMLLRIQHSDFSAAAFASPNTALAFQ